ncbi:hypothetical protein [Corynebacterium sp.]|uniref:hypothetical protein n=1 Tax=Corynebacterium sp. TaxID=1720 RepID=UPI0029038CDE|nr:hypothetical protein [Corynebacterium sp.]MDU3110469.1 hypothetical protein [Corynebacterium sp.]
MTDFDYEDDMTPEDRRAAAEGARQIAAEMREHGFETFMEWAQWRWAKQQEER